MSCAESETGGGGMAVIRVGTSGFNYPEWKGRFYPSTLATTAMLGYYATRLSTVEINYTFYRAPTQAVIDRWAAETPDSFTLTLKAPRRITHERRLKDAGDAVRRFVSLAATLGPRLGVLLFQLPPNLKRDHGLLESFVDELPRGLRAAFEFRHASWFDDGVYDRLAARNFALCVADTGEQTTPLVVTADYGYLRLRDEGYSTEDLRAWAGRVESTDGWKDAYVYFKHEDTGSGPEFALAFRHALSPARRDIVPASS
jgi:uncharacterized protein YecE (DUF72 family)